MKRRSTRSGFTLVELILTITVMSVMILTVVPLFNVTSRGYTSLEVSTVLSAGTQEALSRIQTRASENKHMFGRDATGIAFLARVTSSVSPAPLSGSLLPIIASTGSLSPASGAFQSTNTGNSLFFASVDKSVDVSTGGATTRIDTNVFNYYYLAPNASLYIGNFPVRDLWEWHSTPYLDYQNINNISNATLKQRVIKKVLAQGYLYAYDASATSVNSAFYQLTSAGGFTSLGSHNIVKNKSEKMIKLIRGVSLGSFVYSVSPNTGGSFTHKFTVPLYAAPSGNFPGGFETMVVGPTGLRRVFIRVVMAAKGSFKGYMAYEQVMLVAARDLW